MGRAAARQAAKRARTPETHAAAADGGAARDCAGGADGYAALRVVRHRGDPAAVAAAHRHNADAVERCCVRRLFARARRRGPRARRPAPRAPRRGRPRRPRRPRRVAATPPRAPGRAAAAADAGPRDDRRGRRRARAVAARGVGAVHFEPRGLRLRRPPRTRALRRGDAVDPTTGEAIARRVLDSTARSARARARARPFLVARSRWGASSPLVEPRHARRRSFCTTASAEEHLRANASSIRHVCDGKRPRALGLSLAGTATTSTTRRAGRPRARSPRA